MPLSPSRVRARIEAATPPALVRDRDSFSSDIPTNESRNARSNLPIPLVSIALQALLSLLHIPALAPTSVNRIARPVAGPPLQRQSNPTILPRGAGRSRPGLPAPVEI